MLPFCHRLLYGSVIPPGTSFDAGESKVFSVAGLNATASDLWLYRDSNFENPGSIVTGLKYGTEANVGRTGLAVVAGDWPSASAFVPTPPADQSLQPLRISDTTTTNWIAADPNFGTFAPAPIHLVAIAPEEALIRIEAESPYPLGEHRLEMRRDLDPESPWTTLSVEPSQASPGTVDWMVPRGDAPIVLFRVGVRP